MNKMKLVSIGFEKRIDIYSELVSLSQNLVDAIWKDRPKTHTTCIFLVSILARNIDECRIDIDLVEGSNFFH